METKRKLRVGISIGDLNGIGIEIILKAFKDKRMLEFCTPVIFANDFYTNYVNRGMKMNLEIKYTNELNRIYDSKINVYNCLRGQLPKIEYGVENEQGGRVAVESLKSATAALKAGQIDVLVTAPINKNNVQSEEFHFPGHTDYLAQELGCKSLMFLVSEDIKVGLVTDHVPVKEVSEKVTREKIIEKIEIMHRSLERDFGIRNPKIAVLGLNPHCGDKGVIGNEEQEVIIPTVKEIFESGKMVFGTYSSDTFFVNNYKHFDAVLAMYHDQGLIPFKTLSFGNGVNFTAGLDYVRTSPDHGVAYDIAGKGIADESSFRNAVFAAIKFYKNREEWDDIHKDVIKKIDVQEIEEDYFGDGRNKQRLRVNNKFGANITQQATGKKYNAIDQDDEILEELKKQEERQKMPEKEDLNVLSKILNIIETPEEVEDSGVELEIDDSYAKEFGGFEEESDEDDEDI